MIDRGKANVLGVAVNAIDYEAALVKVIVAAKQRVPMAVAAVAVHGVMTGAMDPEHRYRLNTFDLLLPDGQPVRWAMNLLHGTRLRDRVYGPTFMLLACRAAAEASLPIYLYGSQPEVLALLSRRLREKFPSLQIAGSEPSKFRRLSPEEQSDVLRRAIESQAAMVFVGLGCPRQEVWAFENHRRLGMPVIAVGAAFDFHAGTLAQAPALLQRFGLEWLYRLSREPRRLWRRYLYLNPQYTWLVLLQLTGLRRFDLGNATPPRHDLSYG